MSQSDTSLSGRSTVPAHQEGLLPPIRCHRQENLSQPPGLRVGERSRLDAELCCQSEGHSISRVPVRGVGLRRCLETSAVAMRCAAVVLKVPAPREEVFVGVEVVVDAFVFTKAMSRGSRHKNRSQKAEGKPHDLKRTACEPPLHE